MLNKIENKLVELLHKLGTDTVFTIPGSLMHILHDFENSGVFKLYTSTHEEHLGYMAMGYYQHSGKIPIILVSQGPGLTNLVTPVSAAWREQIPIIVISSYFEDEDFTHFQDTNGNIYTPKVQDIFKPITEKQLRLNNHNKNEILNDLTDTIQNLSRSILLEVDNNCKDLSSNINSYELIKSKENGCQRLPFERILEKIPQKKNSAVLVGKGANKMDIEKLIPYLQNKNYKIISTLQAKELIPSDIKGTLGSVGLLGNEKANHFLSSECDQLITIGASLGANTLARWYKGFNKRNAMLFNININEAILPNDFNVKNIVADLKGYKCEFEGEILRDKKSKVKHPIAKMFSRDKINKIFTLEAFRESFLNDSFMRKNDRMFITGGFGPLGSSIPLAIGSALHNSLPHIVIAGDGGFLFSGMILLTLKKYQLPIFIIIIVNNEFKTVASSQKRKFGYSVCTDLVLPNFYYFQDTYDIDCKNCNTYEEVEEQYRIFRKSNKPMITFINDDLIE